MMEVARIGLAVADGARVKYCSQKGFLKNEKLGRRS